jgi:hypothetical protein
MQYVTLGKTGLRVSVAGLGCGGNSRLGLGRGKTEAEAIALTRQALDMGGQSPGYGRVLRHRSGGWQGHQSRAA